MLLTFVCTHMHYTLNLSVTTLHHCFIVDIPKPLLINAAQSLEQIAEIFETEVTQFDALLSDIEAAVSDVKITDNYISMPVSLQQKFVEIVNGLANSTKSTQLQIIALQKDVEAIKAELKSTMTDDKIINGLLEILLGILRGISTSFDTIYQDVETIDASFTDLGNVVDQPNVLIRKYRTLICIFVYVFLIIC